VCGKCADRPCNWLAGRRPGGRGGRSAGRPRRPLPRPRRPPRAPGRSTRTAPRGRRARTQPGWLGTGSPAPPRRGAGRPGGSRGSWAARAERGGRVAGCRRSTGAGVACHDPSAPGAPAPSPPTSNAWHTPVACHIGRDLSPSRTPPSLPPIGRAPGTDPGLPAGVPRHPPDGSATRREAKPPRGGRWLSSPPPTAHQAPGRPPGPGETPCPRVGCCCPLWPGGGRGRG